MSAIFQQRTAPRAADVSLVPETDVGTGRGLPYSLGMLGFCIAAFIWGAVYTQWVSMANSPIMFAGIIAIGAGLPVIAGILLYTAVRAESDLGTAYLLIGSFWVFNLVVNLLGKPSAKGFAEFLGMTYLVWAVVIGYISTALVLRHPLAALTTFIFGVALALLCIAQWVTSQTTGWNIAAGYAMIVASVIGLLSAMAHRFTGMKYVAATEPGLREPARREPVRREPPL